MTILTVLVAGLSFICLLISIIVVSMSPEQWHYWTNAREVNLKVKAIGSKIQKHDDVIKWKHFPRYWPFVRGIHRSPVDSHHKRPVTQSFDVFFDLRLNKRLSKQWRRPWFETPLYSLWRHCNDMVKTYQHKQVIRVGFSDLLQMGNCALVGISGTINLIPYSKIKSLQRI